jgi:hypothetical protein
MAYGKKTGGWRMANGKRTGIWRIAYGNVTLMIVQDWASRIICSLCLDLNVHLAIRHTPYAV